MKKLIVFNMVTLDGYYAGEDGDISWHKTDAEFGRFAIEQTKTFTTHMYGRVTYEMMADYWPTAHARKEDPAIADLMNMTPKIVFSKTLKNIKDSVNWKHTTVYRGIIPKEIEKMKRDGRGIIAVLGSGEVVQQLTDMGLIDEYRLMVNPVLLGRGKLLFANIKKAVDLKLLRTRMFKNGNVLLIYKPK